ncbi:MAG: phosphoribosylformylglycinamidine synthase subunit PurS [Alphaproteobacteria bacterium]
MLFDVKVHVELKDGVLDTAGKAVSKSLSHLGYEHIDRSIRIGKIIKLQLDEENIKAAEQKTEEICHKLLANPVIEQYQFFIEEA